MTQAMIGTRRGCDHRASVWGTSLGLVAGILMMLPSPTLAEPSNEQIKALNTAESLLADEQHQRAADVLRDMIDKDPTIADAHRLLGHAYDAMDQPKKARQAFTDAIGRGRLTAATLGRLIRLDRDAGRSHAVLAGLWLRSLFAPEARDWQKLHMRVLLKLNWPRRAQALGHALTRQRPADRAAWQLLGNSYLKTDDYRAATEPLSLAYYLGKPRPALARTIGDVWDQRDRPREAIRWYDRAIARQEPSPERDALVLRRATLLLATDMTDRRVPALRRLASRDDAKQAGEAALRLGQLAQARGDRQAAADHWQRAVSLGIEKARVFEALGTYYFGEGQHRRAARYLDQAMDRGQTSRRVHRRLIRSLLRSEQPDAARRQLTAFIARFGLSDAARAMTRDWQAAMAE